MYSGAANLTEHKKEVNDLNVFPVPDGDTGTNMEFTIKGAIKGAESAEGDLSDVAKSMAKGALMGARGNSGVILSQFLKGISVGFQDVRSAGARELAEAFRTGVQYAYKSVLKPTEGTILTVMREATDYAIGQLEESSTVESVLTDFLKEAKASLKRTPDLLPVLKKAGVIDSGAQGLIYIIEGFRKCVRGEDDGTYEEVEAESSQKMFGPDSKLEYGYCTEFILQLMNYKTDIPSFDLKTITDYLETIGDSIVAIKDDDVVKIHVHTMTPAKAIEFCQRYGEFITFKMENMSVQHSETEFARAEEEVAVADSSEGEKVKYGVVAVCTGEKLSRTFREMGANRIIEGGQTMNPSSEEFIKAFSSLNAENILVFPNNSNVFLAAKQAADMYENANVIVLNTSTIAEGYAALTMLDVTIEDPEKLKEELEAAADNVETVQVTYAIRDGAMDGVAYKKGDYIGVAGKNMLSASGDKTAAAVEAVCALPDVKEREIVTVIYGADVTEEEKAVLKVKMGKSLPHVEIYEIDGGQDVYSFVIAVE